MELHGMPSLVTKSQWLKLSSTKFQSLPSMSAAQPVYSTKRKLAARSSTCSSRSPVVTWT